MLEWNFYLRLSKRSKRKKLSTCSGTGWFPQIPQDCGVVHVQPIDDLTERAFGFKSSLPVQIGINVYVYSNSNICILSLSYLERTQRVFCIQLLQHSLPCIYSKLI